KGERTLLSELERSPSRKPACRVRHLAERLPKRVFAARCGRSPLQCRNVRVANKSRVHLAILDLTLVRPRHFEIEHAHPESLLTLISPPVARTDHDADTGFLLAPKIEHGVRDRWIALNRISPGPEEQVARF